MFNQLGISISRKRPTLAEPQYDYYRNDLMIAGLQHAKDRGLTLNTIVDVGAAAGSWSLSALEFWPYANYVLLEPLEERKAELDALCAKHPNFHFIPAAAGKEKGTVNFYVSGDLDGSGVADELNGATISRAVPVISIAGELSKMKLEPPYLIKLDTHGFEVPILEGCASILPDVSLFIIECYGFQIAKDSLLFWEMCRYMDEKGFRLIDIVDIINRPKDHAFWQCDAFFAPAHLDIFKNNSYA
jgi:FkbM family methyltransferase